MKDYLATVLTPLLSYPEILRIEEIQDNLGVFLQVKVAPQDIPCMIGKQGSMARAIRQVMRLYGARNKARVSVRFLEPNK
jgi:predicted RNA-binding protein YlqC (UPF0109 family)